METRSYKYDENNSEKFPRYPFHKRPSQHSKRISSMSTFNHDFMYSSWSISSLSPSRVCELVSVINHLPHNSLYFYYSSRRYIWFLVSCWILLEYLLHQSHVIHQVLCQRVDFELLSMPNKKDCETYCCKDNESANNERKFCS